MHEIWLSDPAKLVFDALSEPLQDDFERICLYIATSLTLLVSTKLVTQYRLYGKTLLRYWDNVFPYLMYFSLTTMGEGDPRPVIEVHSLLRSEPDPPTQVRI